MLSTRASASTWRSQATNRIPIAMVCSGINAPADHAFDKLLRRERGVDLQSFSREPLDIRELHPAYIGPSLPADVDLWGVRRKAVNYGLSSYDEIEYYPLARAHTPGLIQIGSTTRLCIRVLPLRTRTANPV